MCIGTRSPLQSTGTIKHIFMFLVNTNWLVMIIDSCYSVQTPEVAFSVITEILKKHPELSVAGKGIWTHTSVSHCPNMKTIMPTDSEWGVVWFSVNKILRCPANPITLWLTQNDHLLIDALSCVWTAPVLRSPG